MTLSIRPFLNNSCFFGPCMVLKVEVEQRCMIAKRCVMTICMQSKACSQKFDLLLKKNK